MTSPHIVVWYRAEKSQNRNWRQHMWCDCSTVRCERWENLELDPKTRQQVPPRMVWTGVFALANSQRYVVLRPAIAEVTKYLDKYFFRLKRNRQESMSAWALREEKVYLQMTRASARLEQTADSTEPDWDLLYERQQTRSRWTNWSGSWRTHQKGVTYESVDCDGGNA